MHENREISSTPSGICEDGSVKARNRTTDMHVLEKSDCIVVCAERRTVQEGSSPSGARMRGAISKGGGNASLAGKEFPGGQGVHREVKSEGHEEKYRAVIDGATPTMNRSAKGGARSSLHYGGEGALIHPPHQGVCGRHGREEQYVTSGGLVKSRSATG